MPNSDFLDWLSSGTQNFHGSFPLGRGRHNVEILCIYMCLYVLDTFINGQRKSYKHASIACGQFLRKLWTFLVNNNFLAAYPSMATSLYYYPQLIHFWMKISDKMEKIQFYALLCSKKVWEYADIFQPQKFGLQTKINFFHVWWKLALNTTFCDVLLDISHGHQNLWEIFSINPNRS